MKIIDLTKYEKLEDIYILWNKIYGNIYPITNELFERNLSNASLENSYVAIDENENLIAFIICKFWNDEFEISTYNDSCWISLFCVDTKYRNQGIGSKLLELVENKAIDLNKKKIYLGKDYNNYFPGLPVDLKSSTNWFCKRGFTKTYDTYDLIKVINCHSLDKISMKNVEFLFRTATIDDKDELVDFVHRNWPGRWEKEIRDYFKMGGNGEEYAIAVDNGIICAFAKMGLPTTKTSLISYSLTWRKRFNKLGGIGPLGVDISYRKKYLGYDIVAYANNVLIDKGVTDIIIDWTGLLDFYRRMGFEVFKSYSYMIKELKKDYERKEK